MRAFCVSDAVETSIEISLISNSAKHYSISSKRQARAFDISSRRRLVMVSSALYLAANQLIHIYHESTFFYFASPSDMPSFGNGQVISASRGKNYMCGVNNILLWQRIVFVKIAVCQPRNIKPCSIHPLRVTTINVGQPAAY